MENSGVIGVALVVFECIGLENGGFEWQVGEIALGKAGRQWNWHAQE